MNDKEFSASIDAVVDIAKETGRMPENLGSILLVARMLHEINKTLDSIHLNKINKDEALNFIGKDYCKKHFDLVEDKI